MNATPRKRGRPRVHVHRDTTIVSLFFEGWPLNDLAATFEISRSRVDEIIREAGVTASQKRQQCKKRMADMKADRLERIKGLRAQGWTHQKIADEIGITQPHVSYLLKGWSPPGDDRKRMRMAPKKADHIERIKGLRAQGWSQRKIAEEIGISSGYVSRLLRRNGS